MRAYRTIRGTWVAEFEEKKSRFIGHATHVESEEEVIAFRSGIKERIPEASHYVSAYAIHDPFTEHYSDAKEPHGTAGPPVLQVIKSLELEDVVCVVARIFGGTLLGRGGLMRAYTKAAQLAFAEAEVVTRAPCRDTIASIEYPLYEQARKLLEAEGVRVLGCDFGAEVAIEFRTLSQDTDETCRKLTELCNGRIELLTGDESIQSL
ncbi:MAG: IMPACT family protein [Coriobacteriales bacterium]|jgi:uncharacterized YigZ family protein